MKKDLVGVRFAPTGEELIIFYLMNQILGYTYLVVDAINEINILNYEPMLLPSLAKIDSGDLAWYFFSPIVYADSKKKKMQRTLASGNGYWKSSGQDRTVKGKRMSKGEIGIKKSFVYYEKGNKVPTPWIMHEYHITLSPEQSNYVENKYVICKVMYNGEDEDITFGGNNLNDQSQSFVSSDTSCNMRPINTQPEQGQEIDYGSSMDELMNLFMEHEPVSLCDVLDPKTNTMSIDNNNNPSVQPEAQNDDEFLSTLMHVDRRQAEYFLSDEELISRPTENFNVNKPKKSVSGIIDYSSDSDDDDADSTSELSYQGSSSPDSVHNSNRHFLQINGDEIRSKDKTEVKQDRSGSVDTSMDKKETMVKTEKKSWPIAEEAMETNHKNPRCIYLMNTMISFILLLGYFGNIISALQ